MSVEEDTSTPEDEPVPESEFEEFAFQPVRPEELVPRLEPSAPVRVQRRAEQRYLVRWKVIIVPEGKHKGGGGNIHGRVYDLSLLGMAIHTDCNYFVTGPCKVLIALPPLHKGGRESIIEVSARLVYNVLDGKARSFRIGMRFIRFKKNGFDLLRDRLHNHHIPAPF